MKCKGQRVKVKSSLAFQFLARNDGAAVAFYALALSLYPSF
jgi:hypothetical protein